MTALFINTPEFLVEPDLHPSPVSSPLATRAEGRHQSWLAFREKSCRLPVKRLLELFSQLRSQVAIDVDIVRDHPARGKFFGVAQTLFTPNRALGWIT